MKTLSLALLFLLIAGCETADGPSATPLPLVTAPPSGPIKAYTRADVHFKLGLVAKDFDPDIVQHANHQFRYFDLWGPYFDYPHDSLTIYVNGRWPTPTPDTVQLELTIGNRSSVVPIIVEIIPLTQVADISTNAPNDTIVVPRGGNVELKVAYLDSLGHPVPKSILYPYSINIYHEVVQFPPTKVTVVETHKDDIYHYYTFSAFSDITPSNNDTNIAFRLFVAERIFEFPIRIVY